MGRNVGVPIAMLLHGQPDDVYELLDDNEMTESELRAALQNAFMCIKRLQLQVSNLTQEAKGPQGRY